MNRIKKDGDETYNIFNESNEMIGVLKKNSFGTHGHWRGWNHYVYCKQLGRFAWAGSEIPINGKLQRWADAQVIFLNLKEAKQYYMI